MPKVIITLQDKLNGDGKSVCNASFKLDREGYPLDGPPTDALMLASTIRILGDLGVYKALMPLIEVKLQHDELIAFLKSINAIDENGNVHVRSTRPEMSDVKMADVTDIDIIDAAKDNPVPAA